MSELHLSDNSITRTMIRPFQLKDLKLVLYGWYIHLDLNHQKGAQSSFSNDKPYGGWFYQYTPDGWRNEVGCLDCGPFEATDWFLGPIDIRFMQQTHELT
jgi:hypothetical protein